MLNKIFYIIMIIALSFSKLVAVDDEYANSTSNKKASALTDVVNSDLENYLSLAQETKQIATIPPVTQEQLEIYQRFLKGVLIYKPQEGSDAGKVELPIREVADPKTLEGTFDLSQCGDAGKYLSISTGYRKGKIPGNENKIEIWIAPRFLIEKELKTTAKHFEKIFSAWEPSREVGIFWTWGGWDTLTLYDSLTTESMNDLGKHILYEKWNAMARASHRGSMLTGNLGRGCWVYVARSMPFKLLFVD